MHALISLQKIKRVLAKPLFLVFTAEIYLHHYVMTILLNSRFMIDIVSEMYSCYLHSL